MSDDLKTLDGTLDTVWARLKDGVARPEAPARNIALATQSVQGGGAVRIVVLRKADRESGALTVYTHRASAKVAELVANPRAEALVWDAETSLQIRLRLITRVEDGPANLWQSFGPGTRRNYASTPLPGTPLEKAGHFDPVPDPDQFMVITGQITEIETLYLGPGLQRRALFTSERAEWIAP